jgi:hypothetical protein
MLVEPMDEVMGLGYYRSDGPMGGCFQSGLCTDGGVRDPSIKGETFTATVPISGTRFSAFDAFHRDGRYSLRQYSAYKSVTVF